jgi:hypothetical protein
MEGLYSERLMRAVNFMISGEAEDLTEEEAVKAIVERFGQDVYDWIKRSLERPVRGINGYDNEFEKVSSEYPVHGDTMRDVIEHDPPDAFYIVGEYLDPNDSDLETKHNFYQMALLLANERSLNNRNEVIGVWEDGLRVRSIFINGVQFNAS